MKNGWSRNAISGEKWVVSSCAFSILSSAPSPPRVACRQAIARGAIKASQTKLTPNCVCDALNKASHVRTDEHHKTFTRTLKHHKSVKTPLKHHKSCISSLKHHKRRNCVISAVREASQTNLLELMCHNRTSMNSSVTIEPRVTQASQSNLGELKHHKRTQLFFY